MKITKTTIRRCMKSLISNSIKVKVGKMEKNVRRQLKNQLRLDLVAIKKNLKLLNMLKINILIFLSLEIDLMIL